MTTFTIMQFEIAFAGPSPALTKKRAAAHGHRPPESKVGLPLPRGSCSVRTRQGRGVGLLALLAVPLGPHVDSVCLPGHQAGEDRAALLPGHRRVPGPAVRRGVAHHVLVDDSLDWGPGHHRRVFSHSLSGHIGRAINFFRKRRGNEKLEKSFGWSRSRMLKI